MNVFEPLFLVLVLTTVVTLTTATVVALRGQRPRAARILRRLAVGAAVYFVMVIVTSALTPRRVFAVGQPQCFDDWCITVTGSRAAPTAPRDLDVDVRISNRARRVPMGERGAAVYLI